jgi:hypothetical protein
MPAWSVPGIHSRVVARHAVVAREAVHDGLVERMAHVQGAGHIGWRQLNGKRWSRRLGDAGAAKACYAIATLLPFRAPMGLQGGGFKGFGQAF